MGEYSEATNPEECGVMKAKGRRRASGKKVFSKAKTERVSIDFSNPGITSYVKAMEMECGTHTRQGLMGKRR